MSVDVGHLKTLHPYMSPCIPFPEFPLGYPHARFHFTGNSHSHFDFIKKLLLLNKTFVGVSYKSNNRKVISKCTPDSYSPSFGNLSK